MNPKTIARQFAIVLFGVVVPMVILAQAYIGFASLGFDVNCTRTTDDLVNKGRLN